MYVHAWCNKTALTIPSRAAPNSSPKQCKIEVAMIVAIGATCRGQASGVGKF